MKALDKMALKWITSQASLNEMIALNKAQNQQIETLIAINKELRKKVQEKSVK